jgi:hypothetical protein
MAQLAERLEFQTEVNQLPRLIIRLCAEIRRNAIDTGRLRGAPASLKGVEGIGLYEDPGMAGLSGLPAGKSTRRRRRYGFGCGAKQARRSEFAPAADGTLRKSTKSFSGKCGICRGANTGSRCWSKCAESGVRIAVRESNECHSCRARLRSASASRKPLVKPAKVLRRGKWQSGLESPQARSERLINAVWSDGLRRESGRR